MRPITHGMLSTGVADLLPIVGGRHLGVPEQWNAVRDIPRLALGTGEPAVVEHDAVGHSQEHERIRDRRADVSGADDRDGV